MKARIRRLSTSVDSPTIVIDQTASSNDESQKVGSDGTSPSESRIDRMKKLLSSPLSRRKSSTSNPQTNPENSAKTFGATLSSLAFQQQEQQPCPSSLHPSTTTPSMTVSQTETRLISCSSIQAPNFLSMDTIPTRDYTVSTLSPNVSFDASSLSPSPPITSSLPYFSNNTRLMKQPGIPFIISRLCNFIESNSGLTLEGLFRVSGNVKLVEKLKNSFDTFGDAPLEAMGDVPSAAALIKLFLRELPEPVIPTNVHRSFLDIVQDPTKLNTNREESLENLKKLIDDRLPPENYYILKYLCSFLHRVSMNESSNRMNSASLGIVFGPNIFRLSAEDYRDLKDKAISGPNILVSMFIAEHDNLFSSNHHPLGSTSAYSSHIYDISDQVTVDPESIPSSSFDYGSNLKGERFSSLLDERIRMEEVSVKKSGHTRKNGNKKKSSSFDTQMISTSIDSSSASKLFSSTKLSSSTDSPIKSSEKIPQDVGKKSKYSLPKIIPLLTLSKTDQGSSTRLRFGKKRKETSGSPSSSCQNILSDDHPITYPTSTLGTMMMNMQPPIHAELLRSCSEERASPSPIPKEQDDNTDASTMRRCMSSEAVLKLSSSLGSSDQLQAGTDDDDHPSNVGHCENVEPPSFIASQIRISSSISPELLHPTGSTIDDCTSSHDSLASCSLLDDFMNANVDRRKSSDEILGTKRKNSLKSQGKIDSPPGPSVLRPSSIDRVKRMENIKRCSDQLPDLVLVCEPNNNNDEKSKGSMDKSSLDIVITGIADENAENEILDSNDKSAIALSPSQNQSIDIVHRNSWPGAVKDSHSPVKDNDKGRDSLDSNASNENSMKTVNKSYPLTNTLVNQLKMSENNPFEAPLSPSAFRAYLAQRSKRLADPSSAPSPPVDHQFNRQQQFGSTASKYCPSSLIVKEAKQRISHLKQELKDFESSYEQRHGSRPSHDVKINSPVAKPLLLELGKLRKGLKEMKEDHSIRRDLLDLDVLSFAKNVPEDPSYGSSSQQTCPFLSSFIRSHKKSPSSSRRRFREDDIDFLPFKSTNDSLSANIGSDLLIESFNELQVALRSKRLLAARPELLDSMTAEQVIGEKLDLQKALLKFESTYGRPSTKQERDVMRPIYDRYRSVKRIVARMPKSTAIPAPGAVTSGSDSDLQPILENVVMSFESPMPSANTQMPSATSPKQGDVDLQVGSVDKSSSSLHELSLMELLSEVNESRIEKKRLRKLIKSAEEDYTKKTGKKMEKDDRSEYAQSIYNEYKHVKGKLRLLEALVLKREKGTEKSYSTC